MTKRCSHCRRVKPVTDFNPHVRRGYQSRCRQCHAAYNRAHYRKNRAAYLSSASESNQRRTEWYRSLKDGECADCGKKYHHAVMQWDHLEDKTNGVSALFVQGRSKDVILAEIKKCDLVCANCHAMRTWNRRML